MSILSDRLKNRTCSNPDSTCRSLYLGALAALTAALLAPHAMAQDATPAPTAPAPTDQEAPVDLPEFTVSATKVAKPIREVPMSVQPISGDVISDYKLFDAKDITSISAGLDVNTASPNNPIPSMRGITYDAFSGVQPTVNIYWNEISVGAGTAFKAMYDMGQVEVLRGPQGALRAGAAPGGAVLFGTRKAELDGTHVTVQQSFSDKNLWNSQFSLNVPIIKDKLAVRIAGLYDGNEANYVHNIITGKDSDSYTRSLRASLKWKPFEGTTINLVHQYMFQRKSVGYGVAGKDLFNRADLPDVISPFQRIAVAPTDNLNTSRSRLTALTLDVELPGRHQLNIIGGLTKDSMNTFISQNRGNLILDFLGTQYTTSLKSPMTASFEARLNSVNHKFWNYSFGTYLTEQDGNTELTIDGSVLSPANGSPTSKPTMVVVSKGSKITSMQRIHAFFTTQSINITKDLKLEIGIRQQETINRAVNNIPLYVMYGTMQVATIPTSPTITNSDVKPTTSSANLTYKVNSKISSYLSFSQSYRPPGSGVNGSGNVDANKYFSYNAERSNGLELGIKSSLLNKKLQLNADVYLQKFKNYQYYATAAVKGTAYTSDSYQRFVTTGDAESKGAELGMTWSLPYRFVLNLDGAYAESVWKSGTKIPGSVLDPVTGKFVFNTPGEPVSLVEVGGQRLGNVPQLTSSARLEWSRVLKKHEFFARALMKYKGDRILNTATADHLGGYSLFDLQAGFRAKGGKWEVTFWAKNIMDKEAVDYFEDPFTARGFTSGFKQIVVADPREVGVTLNCRF